jgi:hypothetical protein
MGSHRSVREVSVPRWRRVTIVGAGVAVACATVAGVGIASGTTSPTPSVYTSLAPTAVGQYSVAGGGNKDVTVAGVDGVPSSATSVQLSVTALNESATSSLYVYATGTTQPSSANLRWATGEVATAPITTAVGTNGQIHLHNTTGTAQIKISVIGYYSPAPASGGVGYGGTVGGDEIASTDNGGTIVSSVTVPAGTYAVEATASMSLIDSTTTEQAVCNIRDPAGLAVSSSDTMLHASSSDETVAMTGLDTTSGGVMTFHCTALVNDNIRVLDVNLVAIKLSSATGFVIGG